MSAAPQPPVPGDEATLIARLNYANRVVKLCGELNPNLQPSDDYARKIIALRLASPKRAEAGHVIASQADAGHLPLFVAADEPSLF